MLTDMCGRGDGYLGKQIAHGKGAGASKGKERRLGPTCGYPSKAQLTYNKRVGNTMLFGVAWRHDPERHRSPLSSTMRLSPSRRPWTIKYSQRCRALIRLMQAQRAPNLPPAPHQSRNRRNAMANVDVKTTSSYPNGLLRVVRLLPQSARATSGILAPFSLRHSQFLRLRPIVVSLQLMHSILVKIKQIHKTRPQF